MPARLPAPSHLLDAIFQHTNKLQMEDRQAIIRFLSGTEPLTTAAAADHGEDDTDNNNNSRSVRRNRMTYPIRQILLHEERRTELRPSPRPTASSQHPSLSVFTPTHSSGESSAASLESTASGSLSHPPAEQQTASGPPSGDQPVLKSYTIVDQIIFEMDYATGCWRKLRRRIRMATDRRSRDGEEDASADAISNSNGEGVAAATLLVDPNNTSSPARRSANRARRDSNLNWMPNAPATQVSNATASAVPHAASFHAATASVPVNTNTAARVSSQDSATRRGSESNRYQDAPTGTNGVRRVPLPMALSPAVRAMDAPLTTMLPTVQSNTEGTMNSPQSATTRLTGHSLHSPRRAMAAVRASMAAHTPGGTIRLTGFDVPAVPVTYPASDVNQATSQDELERIRRQSQQHLRRLMDSSRTSSHGRPRPDHTSTALSRPRHAEGAEQDALSRLARGDQLGIDWASRRRMWWPWREGDPSPQDPQDNPPRTLEPGNRALGNEIRNIANLLAQSVHQSHAVDTDGNRQNSHNMADEDAFDDDVPLDVCSLEDTRNSQRMMSRRFVHSIGVGR